MNKTGYIYIMTNKSRTTLYIGVTNDLCQRIYEHKNHLIRNSFTDKYNLEYCIYYEEFPYLDLAIKREKELKKWKRQKKENLINRKNPEWKVVVTENGFLRNTPTFSQHPENTRDSSLSLGMTNDSRSVVGERGGGFAATSLSPLSSEKQVIPNGTQWSEESAINKRSAITKEKK